MTGSDIGWATNPNLRYLPTPAQFTLSTYSRNFLAILVRMLDIAE
jgi:hypothetical protein